MNNQPEIVKELKKEEEFGLLGISENHNNKQYEHINIDYKKCKILFNELPFYTYLISPEGLILEVNDIALKTLEYSKKELVGKHLKTIYAPESHQKVENLLSKWKETGEINDEEMIIISKYGNKRTVLLNVRSVRNDYGEILHSFSIQKDITDEKKLLVDLKQIGEEYRFLVDSLHELILILDKQGSIHFANKYGSILSGYTIDELIGKKITQFLTRNSSKKILSAITQGFLGHHQSSVIIDFKTKNSNIINLEVNKNLIPFKEDGKITKILINARDITKKIKAQRHLIEIKERYDALFNGLNDLVFIHDFKGNIINANDAVLSLTGYNKDELKSLNFASFLDKKQLLRAMKDIQEIKKNGQLNQSSEYKIKIKNGEYIDIEIMGSLIYHEKKPVAIQVVARNITERKKLWKMINNQRNLSQKFLNVVGVIIVLINKKGIVTLINEKGCEVLGYKIDEIIGKNWFENFIPTEIKEDVKNASNKLFKGEIEESEYFENQIVTKKGAKKLIAWHNTVVEDDDGNIIGQLSSGEDITNHRKVEIELKESNDKYKTLVENSREGVVLIRDEKIVFCNNAMEKLFGYSRNDMINRNFIDFIPKNNKQFSLNIYNKRLNGFGSSDFYETKILDLEGNERWVEISGNIIELKNQKVDMVVIHDITQRKRNYNLIKIQNDLAMSLNKTSNLECGLQLCLDAALLCSDLDSGGVYLFDESEALKLFCHRGLSPEFIKSVSYFESNSSNVKIVKKGKPVYIKYCDLGVILNEYGKKEKLRSIAVIPFSNEGEVIGCINVASHTQNSIPMFSRRSLDSTSAEIGNIVSSLKMKELLKVSEEKYRNLSELLPEIVFEMDETGVLTFVNRQAFEMTGYSKDDFDKGFHALNLICPEDQKKALQNIKRVMNGEKINPVEYLAKRKDGTTFPILVYSSQIIKNNQVVGLRGIIIDITDRKKMLDELKDAQEMLLSVNKTLEDKVNDRTKEIEQLLKQKDDFINQLGHDLKNPLTPLINLLPLIEKKTMDSRQKKIFTIINRCVGYMKNLVLKTIELAKLNSSNIVFNFEDVDLSSEVKKVIDINQMMFDSKKIKIVNNVADNLAVHADKIYIEELFTNLLNNSFKYTNKSGIITIDAMENDGSILVSIKDTGIGMTKDQLDHIFDEFYKSDITRHDFDSSGLGLSICKRIVERHGGKVWAESEGFEKGSTFYFTIPKTVKNCNNKDINDRYFNIESERVSFISYKGKEILYSDYSNLEESQFINAINDLSDFVKNLSRKNLLTLSNVSGTYFKLSSINYCKKIGQILKPYLGKSAVIGISKSQEVFIKALKLFTKINLKTFEDIKDAKNWLIEN